MSEYGKNKKRAIIGKLGISFILTVVLLLIAIVPIATILAATTTFKEGSYQVTSPYYPDYNTATSYFINADEVLDIPESKNYFVYIEAEAHNNVVFPGAETHNYDARVSVLLVREIDYLQLIGDGLESNDVDVLWNSLVDYAKAEYHFRSETGVKTSDQKVLYLSEGNYRLVTFKQDDEATIKFAVVEIQVGLLIAAFVLVVLFSVFTMALIILIIFNLIYNSVSSSNEKKQRLNSLAPKPQSETTTPVSQRSGPIAEKRRFRNVKAENNAAISEYQKTVPKGYIKAENLRTIEYKRGFGGFFSRLNEVEIGCLIFATVMLFLSGYSGFFTFVAGIFVIVGIVSYKSRENMRINLLEIILMNGRVGRKDNLNIKEVSFTIVKEQIDTFALNYYKISRAVRDIFRNGEARIYWDYTNEVYGIYIPEISKDEEKKPTEPVILTKPEFEEFCYDCGALIEDVNARFCLNCGIQLKAAK